MQGNNPNNNEAPSIREDNIIPIPGFQATQTNSEAAQSRPFNAVPTAIKSQNNMYRYFFWGIFICITLSLALFIVIFIIQYLGVNQFNQDAINKYNTIKASGDAFKATAEAPKPTATTMPTPTRIALPTAKSVSERMIIVPEQEISSDFTLLGFTLIYPSDWTYSKETTQSGEIHKFTKGVYTLSITRNNNQESQKVCVFTTPVEVQDGLVPLDLTSYTLRSIQFEVSSKLLGYYKTNTSTKSEYFTCGGMGTDIVSLKSPTDWGIIKFEGPVVMDQVILKEIEKILGSL